MKTIFTALFHSLQREDQPGGKRKKKTLILPYVFVWTLHSPTITWAVGRLLLCWPLHYIQAVWAMIVVYMLRTIAIVHMRACYVWYVCRKERWLVSPSTRTGPVFSLFYYTRLRLFTLDTLRTDALKLMCWRLLKTYWRLPGAALKTAKNLLKTAWLIYILHILSMDCILRWLS